MVTNRDPLIFVKEPLTHFPSRSGCLIGQLDKVRPGAVQRLPTRRTSPVAVRGRPATSSPTPSGRRAAVRQNAEYRAVRVSAPGPASGGGRRRRRRAAAGCRRQGRRSAFDRHQGGQWVRGRSQHLGCSGTRTCPAGCGTQAGAGAGIRSLQRSVHRSSARESCLPPHGTMGIPLAPVSLRRYGALALLGSACLRQAPNGRPGATATGPQAEICRRYGDGASVPLERWGARSPMPDHESCRGVPLPSTTGRCLGW